MISKWKVNNIQNQKCKSVIHEKTKCGDSSYSTMVWTNWGSIKRFKVFITSI